MKKKIVKKQKVELKKNFLKFGIGEEKILQIVKYDGSEVCFLDLETEERLYTNLVRLKQLADNYSIGSIFSVTYTGDLIIEQGKRVKEFEIVICENLNHD